MAKKECSINTECYIQQNGIDVENHTIPVVLSDETPMERYDWELGNFTLILDHNEDSVDMARSEVMSVFWSHNDYALPLGLYQDVRLEDGKLKAVAHFDSDDKFAMDVFNKAKKGILKTLSVGAYILEKTIIKDELTGKTTVRATKWQPYEGSFTGNPANENAKVGLKNQIQQKEENMTTLNDVKVFIATANDADKTLLSTALGAVATEQLTAKTNEMTTLSNTHTQALSDKEASFTAAMATANDSMKTVLKMVTDSTYSAMKDEDKATALDKVTLSADGTFDKQAFENTLLKATLGVNTPQGGEHHNQGEDDDTPEEVKNMGGKF